MAMDYHTAQLGLSPEFAPTFYFVIHDIIDRFVTMVTAIEAVVSRSAT